MPRHPAAAADAGFSINLMTEVEAAKDSKEFADIEENDFAEFDFDDETD